VLSKFSCSYVFLHNTYVVSVNYLFDIFWSYYQILFADHVIIQIFPYFFSPEITSELRVRELLDRPSVRELLASRARTAELDSRIQIPVQVPVLPAVRKPDDEYPPPPSYESVAVYAMYEPPPPYQERPWTSFSWTNQIYFEKVLPDIFTILSFKLFNQLSIVVQRMNLNFLSPDFLLKLLLMFRLTNKCAIEKNSDK
jgi:hypothetical protein